MNKNERIPTNFSQIFKSKKKNFSLWIWIVGIAFILGVVSIGIVWNLNSNDIEFETQKPTRGEIHSSISASGSLSPLNEVEIGSVISGLVQEVLVQENDRVQKGQVLARINPESINQQIAKYTAQLNSALAQLKASQQNLNDKKWHFQQLSQLHKASNSETPSLLELQNAKTSYASAQADVDIKKALIREIETSIESAKIDLKNSEIISPVDGIVLTRSIEVGQSVAASFQAPTLFKVAENLEEMQLYASISEADIGKVKEGQSVFFSVDAYPEKIFNAKVNRVNFGSGDGSTSSSSNTANASNIVIYRAKIEVDNKSLLLRPDMSATADIIIAKADNALLVPHSALYFDLHKALQKTHKPSSKNLLSSLITPPTRPKTQSNLRQKSKSKTQTLWILKNNKPEKIEVEVGITDGDYAEILSGLSEDMQVITAVKTN